MRKLVILFLLFSLLAGGGCWDRREIEQRGFVVGVGLDNAPLPKATPQEAAGSEGYEVTVQVALPSQTAGGSSAAGGGGGNVQPFWNIVTAGGSIFEAIMETSTRIYRTPYFAFTQVIVIGEGLARRGILESIDYLARDNEIRRRVVVYVTSAKAVDILNIKPRLEPVNAFYLGKLAQNQSVTNKIPPPMDLGRLGRSLHEGCAYLLPRVEPGKDDVKLAGAALFHGDRMLGWLDEGQAEAQRWITDRIMGGTVTTLIQGQEVVLNVINSSTTLVPELEGGRLTMLLKVRTEGELAENQVNSKGTAGLYPAFMREAEAGISEQIKKAMKTTISEVQRKYQADIFGFDRAVERRYPALWKEIGATWEKEYFPSLDVEVQVNTDIRRIGLES